MFAQMSLVPESNYWFVEPVEDVKCCMPAAKETGFISLITSYAGKVKISFTGDEGYANIEEINQ